MSSVSFVSASQITWNKNWKLNLKTRIINSCKNYCKQRKHKCIYNPSAELAFTELWNVIVIIQIVKYMEMPKGKSVAILIKWYLHFSPPCERQLTFYFHYTLHINSLLLFFHSTTKLHCSNWLTERLHIVYDGDFNIEFFRNWKRKAFSFSDVVELWKKLLHRAHSRQPVTVLKDNKFHGCHR